MSDNQGFLKKSKTVNISSMVKEFQESVKQKEEQTTNGFNDDMFGDGTLDDIDFGGIYDDHPVDDSKKTNDVPAPVENKEEKVPAPEIEKEKAEEPVITKDAEAPAPSSVVDEPIVNASPQKEADVMEIDDSQEAKPKEKEPELPNKAVASAVEEKVTEPAPPAVTSVLPKPVTLEHEKILIKFVKSHLISTPVIPHEQTLTLAYLSKHLYVPGSNIKTWKDYNIERAATTVVIEGHSLKDYEVVFQGLPLRKKNDSYEPQSDITINNVCWLKAPGMSPKKSDSYVACVYVKAGKGHNGVMFARLSEEQSRALFMFFTDIDTAIACGNMYSFSSPNYHGTVTIPVIPHDIFVEKCHNRKRSGGVVDVDKAKEKEKTKVEKQIAEEKKMTPLKVEPLLKVPAMFRINSVTKKKEQLSSQKIARNINITMRGSEKDVDFENDDDIDFISSDEIGMLSQPLGVDNDLYSRSLKEIDMMMVDDDKRIKELIEQRDKLQKEFDKIDKTKSNKLYINMIERLDSTKAKIEKLKNSGRRAMAKFGGRRLPDITKRIEEVENSGIVGSFSGGRDSWGKYINQKIPTDPIKFCDFKQSILTIKKINNINDKGGETDMQPMVARLENAIGELLSEYADEDSRRMHELNYDWEEVARASAKQEPPKPAEKKPPAAPPKSILKKSPPALNTTLSKKRKANDDDSDDEKKQEDDEDEGLDAEEKADKIIEQSIGKIIKKGDLQLSSQEEAAALKLNLAKLESIEKKAVLALSESMAKIKQFEEMFMDCQRRSVQYKAMVDKISEEKTKSVARIKELMTGSRENEKEQKHMYNELMEDVKDMPPDAVFESVHKSIVNHDEEKLVYFNNRNKYVKAALIKQEESPSRSASVSAKPDPAVAKYVTGQIRKFIADLTEAFPKKERDELARLTRVRNEKVWKENGLNVNNLKKRNYEPTEDELHKKNKYALLPNFAGCNKTNALENFLKGDQPSALNHVANYCWMYDKETVPVSQFSLGSHVNYYSLFRDFMKSNENLNQKFKTQDCLSWAKKENIEGSEMLKQRFEDLKLRVATLHFLHDSYLDQKENKVAKRKEKESKPTDEDEEDQEEEEEEEEEKPKKKKQKVARDEDDDDRPRSPVKSKSKNVAPKDDEDFFA